MSTIDATPDSAENLRQRLDFESLVSDISSKFINLRPGEVDGEIEDALRRLCEPLGIDLAMLWQWSDLTPGVATATHVYTRQGVPPPGPLHQAPFPWHAQELLAGRTEALPSLEALPAAAAVDRENARLIGIRSNLALPPAVGAGQSIGILGLSTVHAKRDWPDVLVKRLQLVVQVFSNALARERQEHKLLQSQDRLAASADLAGLAFYEVDFRDGVAHVDDRLRDLCGIPADRSQGLQALEFWMGHVHPDDRKRVPDLRRQLHARGGQERLSVEYRFPHPTRGERWIHHVGRVARRDASGRTLRSFGVLRDITPSKQAEEAFRNLSRCLIRAHEDECALLARELHDDVPQRLALLAIDMGRAELAAPGGAQADVMRSVRAELVRLSEDIHSLAYQLHPSVLEELGLVEALRAECERRGRQGRLVVAMDLEPVPALAGKSAQLCLFRVAQEAPTNVARHAGTGVASVTLRQVDGGLLLAVGMVATMPFSVPLLVEGLSVSAWMIAEPLLAVVLVPLVIGMVTLRRAPAFAARAQPIVKKITGIATIVMLGLCLAIYGQAFIGSTGSYATLSQVIFYGAVTAGSYMLAFGLPQNRKSVLALSVCTRNLGAAFAPLFAVSGVDERAIVMVALGVLLQTMAAFVAARALGARS